MPTSYCAAASIAQSASKMLPLSNIKMAATARARPRGTPRAAADADLKNEDSLLYEYNGKHRTLAEWAKLKGVSLTLLRSKVKRGGLKEVLQKTDTRRKGTKPKPESYVGRL